MNKTLALEAWEKLLSSENVVQAADLLQNAATATYATSNNVEAILRPTTTEQVSDCLKIANQYQIAVYPISKGKNWGYGSRVPTANGGVLLDLSQLNRIIEFNEDLAYVTVEPGVTQQQLYQFLQEQHSQLWMDSTGSSPDSSLIGNILERGFGHTPYGDRFANICGLEVVIPTGELIHTSFGRFPNAKTAQLYRWGVGAYLDGIFTQSNLGIVTKMTIWLMPAPEYFQAFYFSVKDNSQLPALINALRPLRLNGTIKSAVHLGNSYKVLSAIRQYPWEEAHNTTPLPPETMDYFAKSWDFGAWNGSGGIYGTKTQVAEARRLIKQALKGKVRKLQFIDDTLLRLAQIVAKQYQQVTGLNLPEMLKIIKPVYGLMKGIPTPTQLKSAYWRKKSVPPEQMDLDQDGCGLIWCAPVAPLDGNCAQEINSITQDIFTQYGFEPFISLTLLTERCLGCILTISYDRYVPGEDERAMACYKDLLKALTSSGYYPYRLGVHSMDLLAEGEESYQNLLNKIKTAIDPQNILAPGRYLQS
ncbi:FAD/FMN-dependent dehydrogenase [Hyella patelloides LEGE 07179]|uniref:FAD/FMN-dependent dehydrogenase n=1 Tax=Hyella patelloides LEGE 07179 TaxID=945734 RepID=A0A563VSN7_9CYAN|nr:FAD-binding oxidoreductase [Hyella patelloides]VEP14299.1 FAD/FMN-dependent dehydrogenase [Hyella patelloides LEGE 07179]